MGKVTFTELAFLLVAGPRARRRARRALLDAVLVSLADHGLTPTALAARLTYTGAPESLQGAVAAGLLGAGSVFLGVVEDTARVPRAGGRRPAGRTTRAAAAARAAVEARRAEGGRIPGLGHPVHKQSRTRARRGCTRSPSSTACSARTCGRCGWSPTPTRS